MATSVQVHVDGLEDMGRRFVAAWHRAVAGEAVDEAHVTFLSFDAMAEALSGKRLELLRYLSRNGARNIRELAQALSRDYKNVYQDVKVLERAGLLVREGRKLTAPWTELRSSIKLVA
jgi:predicted transcriptional regulator